MVQINEASKVKIPRRILNSVLISLKSGVVPRTGAPYIAIGRTAETATLVEDLDTVAEGGSSMRFIIGRYGSGKSFLLQLMRGYCTEQGFVCMDADLSPERRLYGTSGSGVATYKELIRNMSTKLSPEGAALGTLVEKQLAAARATAERCGITPDMSEYNAEVHKHIREALAELRLSVGGFDFCEVLINYFKALEAEDDSLCAACLCWLRGEYSTKSEAKRALGFSVSCIPDDDNWFDFIKLWAVYSRLCGYKGLVVMLDECVNLYKITNRVSRENNYEKLLSMFNDTLSARASGLMMLLCGTPQFLEDGRRGLFGYEALRSRLCDSRFADPGASSVNGPVIRLRRLSDDEMMALLLRVLGLYQRMYPDTPAVEPAQLELFYKASLERAGASEMMTPREMIRDFLYILDARRVDATRTFGSFIRKKSSDASASEKNPAEQKKKPSPEDIEI